jgi:O-antigen ligase
MRLRQEELIDTLFWFGAMVLILSIALAQAAPPTGTMYWAPFNGAWRGVYWHRNHLGSIAALLNIIYLIRFLVAMREGRNQGVLDGILYMISLAVIYFTRSATAYILLIVLHGTLFIVWLWLKISHRLRRVHYGFIGGAGLLSAVLVLTNLDFVFGLFNRDVTMTGRVGLWSHLLEIAGRCPWLGHGFGSFWTIEANREEIRRLVGWASQPLIGDNGLLDIYLHLGVIGVLVFVAVLTLAVGRAVRYGLLQRSLAGFFPLLVLVYALVANLSFSLFAESEVFVWMLIVVGLFMTTPTVIAPATPALGGSAGEAAGVARSP